MNPIPGATRTVLADRYALVAPDGHFRVARAGADGVGETGLLGPGLGAGFDWTMFDLAPGARLPTLDTAPASWFVLAGAARLVRGASPTGDAGADARDRGGEAPAGDDVSGGGAVTLTAAHDAAWHALAPTRLLRSRPPARGRCPSGAAAVIAARTDATAPTTTAGRATTDAQTTADAGPRAFRLDVGRALGFRGAPGVTVRALPPGAGDDLWFVLELQPGADLPFVETHPEPHGVWLLEGRGLARLGADWFPIAAGDALWIGAYCPHWFCALGPTPLRYLLLKQPAHGG